MAKVPPNTQEEPEEARYIRFGTLPHGTEWNGKPALNKYSNYVTNAHDFPAAKVSSHQTYTPINANKRTGNALRRRCTTR